MFASSGKGGVRNLSSKKHSQSTIVWLNMRSGELREQELAQGSQQRFPSSSHVMHKLKEAQIQGYIGLCDASMRVKP